MLKTLQPGEKLVDEEDELKDFYVVAEGTLQQVPVGEKIAISVHSPQSVTPPDRKRSASSPRKRPADRSLRHPPSPDSYSDRRQKSDNSRRSLPQDTTRARSGENCFGRGRSSANSR